MQETSWLPLRILSNASSRPSRTSAGRTKGGWGYATTPRDLASCLTSRGVTVSPLWRTRLAVGTAAISVGFSEQAASAPVRTAATPIANQDLRMTPPRVRVDITQSSTNRKSRSGPDTMARHRQARPSRSRKAVASARPRRYTLRQTRTGAESHAVVHRTRQWAVAHRGRGRRHATTVGVARLDWTNGHQVRVRNGPMRGVYRPSGWKGRALVPHPTPERG